MAVVIFLWLEKNGFHASLNIDDRPSVTQLDRYISFYPKGKGFGTVTGTASMGQSVAHDNGKFKTPAEYVSAPILGLDEDAMITWWRRTRGAVQYSALSNNCADVILSALEAGGAKDRGPFIVASIQRARHFVTFPENIRNVADLLAATNPRAGSKAIVQASLAWQAMPIHCDGKGVLQIAAQGSWTFNPGFGAVTAAGAGRLSTQGRSGYAFHGPGGREGQLIGRIGNGQPFVVGANCSFQLGRADVGSLYLVINDDLGSKNGAGLRDNSGSLSVTLLLVQAGQTSTTPTNTNSTITGGGMGTPPVSSLGPPPRPPTVNFGPIRR